MQPESVTIPPIEDPAPPQDDPGRGRLRRLLKSKLVRAAIVVGLLLGALFGFPSSRYAVAGMFIKHTVKVSVVDAETIKPISGAEVAIDGFKGTTDEFGIARIKAVPAGPHTLTATKTYYEAKGQPFTVKVIGTKQEVTQKIKPTGRTVAFKVVDKFTGKAVGSAKMRAADTSATSAEDGTGTIVLPAGSPQQEAVISVAGYNDLKTTVKLASDKPQEFAVVAAGKLYFLDKRTGVINVMKSDLDGSNPTVVLEGTGKEEDAGTVLLASRDWKYLALKSRRDSPRPKLYSIATADDTLSTVDEGDINFELAGWADHHFVYTVLRTENLTSGPSTQSTLKSFDASSGKLVILDRTERRDVAPGAFISSSFTSVYLVGNELVYGLGWATFGLNGILDQLEGKETRIMTVKTDGTSKRSLKTFPARRTPNILSKAYAPDEVLFRLATPNPSGTPESTEYFEYEGGKIVAAKDITDEQFFSRPYPTYLQSPDGTQTFWSEPRNGKQTIFRGNAAGKEGKTLVELSEFKPYGWYTDRYVLLSKGGSELFITGADFTQEPTKIATYHKPDQTFQGYGGGYGGN